LEPEAAAQTTRDLTEDMQELQQTDPFDGPVERLFDRLATHLARLFDAPITLITAVDGPRQFWEAQCGLAEDSFSTKGSERDCSICNTLVLSGSLCVVSDTAEDERFHDDPFLKGHGIRFCVAVPLKGPDEKVIGSLCVLDTRPRQITEKQRETVISVAESVTMAIEMGEPMRTPGRVTPEEVPSN
jgi:GAF domain-containing protein